MLRKSLRISILLECFALVCLAAPAQQVIHAIVGTISSVDPVAKTFAVNRDNDSPAYFKFSANSKTSVDFDKNARTDVSAADEFKKSGARVIVYYFGDGDVLTAVGLRSLQAGTVTKIVGTVVKLDKRKHLLTIAAKSGVTESFEITQNTVAETGMGAVEGLKFQPEEGDQVRVTASQASGNEIALFINAA